MEKFQWLIDTNVQYKLVGCLLNCVFKRGDERLIKDVLERELATPFLKLKNIENSKHLMIHTGSKAEPMFRYEAYSKDEQYLIKIGFEFDKITRIVGYSRWSCTEANTDDLG